MRQTGEEMKFTNKDLFSFAQDTFYNSEIGAVYFSIYIGGDYSSLFGDSGVPTDIFVCGVYGVQSTADSHFCHMVQSQNASVHVVLQFVVLLSC